MKYYILPFIALILTQACVPVSTSTYTPNKTLLYTDYEYENVVGMVQVGRSLNTASGQTNYPVFRSGQLSNITVLFDLIEDNYRPIGLKLIHCNNDWAPSGLADIRFLDEYNSFNINNYQFSSNTRTGYITYSGAVPTPKISGNYLLVAFNGSNETDLLFTRRILVYESTTSVAAEIKMSPSIGRRSENQQIDFGVSYSDLSNVNTLRDLKVVILQNHNWPKALYGLTPTIVRADRNYLEFSHLTGENEFKGGNEFRFFDLRSVDYRGMNVSHVKKEDDRIVAFNMIDKPRGQLAYSQLNQDLNGSYYLENTDPGDTELNSEYVQVYFELQTEELSKPVYIVGRFNNWRKSASNRMTYDTERQSYRGKLMLKQGYYNYAYESDNSSRLEGDFFQTENDYEILVYYRNPANNFDQLVGYKKAQSIF